MLGFRVTLTFALPTARCGRQWQQNKPDVLWPCFSSTDIPEALLEGFGLRPRRTVHIQPSIYMNCHESTRTVEPCRHRGIRPHPTIAVCYIAYFNTTNSSYLPWYIRSHQTAALDHSTPFTAESRSTSITLTLKPWGKLIIETARTL